MKNSIQKILLLLLLISQSIFSNSTTKPPKEVTIDLLNEEFYVQDKDASAVVLKEESSVYYNEDNKIVKELKKIIKIYSKKGIRYGTTKIRLSKSGQLEQEISNIKGYTYSLKGDKITTSKLKKNNIYYKDSKRDKTVTIALPNVIEKSIIEISYTIVSPFNISMPSIYIQQYIPVKELNYKVTIPEYYNFNIQTRGDHIIDIEKDTGTDSKYYDYKDSKGQLTSKSYDFETNIYNIKANNIPAITKEPYVDNIYNYISSINFFLKSISYPSQPIKVYATTWKEVLEQRSKKISSSILKNNFLKNDLKLILQKNFKNSEQKSLAIFDFIIKKMRWNKEYSSSNYKKQKNAYISKIGNSAEINMILISMLNAAELKVKPVFVTTSKIIKSIVPDKNNFDHLLAQVTLEDNSKIYLDATQKKASKNSFSTQVIKGRAMVLNNQKNAVTISLKPNKPSSISYIMDYSLGADNANGTIKKKYADLSAFNYRKRSKIKDTTEIIKKYIKSYKLNDVWNLKRTDLKNNHKPIIESYSFKTDNSIDKIGEEIIFNPMLFLHKKTNPLKLEKRLFPLNLSSGRSYVYLINISIPQNYEIAELPKNLSLKLPEGWGTFSYKISSNKNEIKLSVKEKIQKSFYTPKEYLTLKKIFEQVVKKEKELIVLKLKTSASN